MKTIVFNGQKLEINGIHSDSRKINKDYAFVAIAGTQSDGHAFIDKAIENGATVIVHQEGSAFQERVAGQEITYIQVPDSAEALGQLASLWNDEPSKKLTLVGVTGTNGKTTIATLLYNMFQKLGYKVGLLSTVCNYVNDRAVPSTHTTPDPIELNALLAEMVTEGCEYAFMEVSSHAVVQQRIAGLQFKGGIFTNLTRDHLDYHETVEAYRDAKKGFFDQLPADAFALTNADDKNGLFMLQNTKAAKKTYSFQTLADFKGKIVEAHFDGTEMTINGKEIHTQFVGKFNAYNLLAVYGAAVLLGKNPEDVAVLLSTLTPVSGRFETIRSPKGYTAIVDYAHTPDALTNVLTAIGEVLRDGKIITVVGCGGNRDKGKRPIMAKEAVKLSHQVILTSDNPRNEEPEDIINDMVAGLNTNEREQAVCITDRKEAIRTACLLAKAGDVILIAGKGHEDYQEVKGVKHHFDDKEIVKLEFRA
ncbi:MAG: UDP-N-acetylmuramoyl-L-alanyl-D-glutamate--2,6-diaminopimelate ligase [Candidatus Symbiothrix sp.]|jgi:UDP-N-acetylmuramoyl-L-alanyl-D-glutamate--2,6-diaminopimelate ligase|nr:UDP-N-acetylmuramoyl-L-alanyl-D-glutamate--2,6-diaminopimelate ligase [Candidatus Symbiothrix sp.]